jgi:signal transduction histidine kinase/ActR/RegA family two-component response regulator
MLYRVFALTDSEGNRIGLATVSRDITQRRQLEDDLRRLASELSEAGRRKDEFLAMLAHELRNPLAPVLTGLQVLRMTADNREQVLDASEMMERQVRQMVRLIDDLLDVSRITRGKIELKRNRIELKSVIDHAVEAVRPLREKMNHELTVSMHNEPVIVDGDSARLTQVVGNLLTNACKFTERGGKIDVSLERDGDQAIIRVKDNGVGIARDQLPRLFEMFTQLDATLERSQGGLGIGLNLAKNLVEMHDGTIEVESAGPGHGAEFIVRLPILTDSATQQTQTETRKAETGSPRRRILIVDDNKDSANSLAMLLKLKGHDVHTAHDGQEAVDKSESLRPDAVLLDIGLPRLNGYEAGRQIRNKPWGKNIAMIALTGWGQENDRRQSQDAGFNGHLVKPVDHATLLKLLNDLLDPAGSPT